MRLVIKYKARIIKVALVLFVLFISMGCTKTVNKLEDNIQEERTDKTSITTTSKLLNADEEDNTEEQIYVNMNNHIQALYNAFVACKWMDAYDMLEEFKRPETKETIIYNTPMENVFLVIDYIPEVRSWQAYLGELSGEQKEGKGVMVSTRENGYVFQGVYIGEWNENMPNGKGILSDSLADMEYIFEGVVKDGRYNSNIQVHRLKTPELYVDWETFTPTFLIDAEWVYADINFEEGKPIPLSISVVDEYTAISELTERELSWIKVENDGQYYYVIYDEKYNYVLSVGAKAPGEHRGDRQLLLGTLFDAFNEEAKYGVPCYSTNPIK